MTSYLFTGHLLHSRRDAVRNAFTYPVFNLLVDLDDVPTLHHHIPFFGHNRWNVVSLYDQDHLGVVGHGLKANVLAYLVEQGIDLTGGKIYLSTNPRILGHVFNPVSFFYCYDAGGELVGVIAEVNNTYGERHPYWLSRACALPSQTTQPQHRYWADKQFYVSPFIGPEARYEFTFSPLGRAMSMQIDEYQAGQKFFQARLWGQCQPLTARALAGALWRYPFMTLQVVALIYWQALKLNLRRAQVYAKPDTKNLV